MKMTKMATSVAAIVLMAGPALATDKKFGGVFGGGNSGGAEISNEVGSFTQIGVNNAGVILQGATVDGEIDFEDSVLGRADSLIDLGDLKQQSFNQIWTEGGSVGDTVAFSMDENDDEVFVGNRDVITDNEVDIEDDVETLAIAIGNSKAAAKTEEIEVDIDNDIDLEQNIALSGGVIATRGGDVDDNQYAELGGANARGDAEIEDNLYTADGNNLAARDDSIAIDEVTDNTLANDDSIAIGEVVDNTLANDDSIAVGDNELEVDLD